MDGAVSYIEQYAVIDYEFLKRIVTEGEIWVHTYTLETKLVSMEWKHHASP